jgi:dTDP-4-dehydrorhamnose 3,5-epimerase-like enzyme
METTTNPNARVFVEPMTYPTDERGLVLEPIGADAFPSQKNAHLVLTVPGGVRGNHYHRVGTEIAVVLGPALVRYRDADGPRDHILVFGQALRFTFPPGVPHAMLNIGEALMIIISFNTEVHDPSCPDVVREVLINPN